ncbi:MAG: J domain-containing protein [Lachnospiraceae bacterium]|nr:J domain-containing protein [Lachnospiraceae bacterium]
MTDYLRYLPILIIPLLIFITCKLIRSSGTCIVCKKLAIGSPYRCSDGVICKDCSQLMPSSTLRSLKMEPASTVKRLIDITRSNIPRYRKIFDETSHFGNIHIDERNGLIALCSNREIKDGKLKSSCKNIFSVLNVQDCNFNIKTESSSENAVKVSIHFILVLAEPNITIKEQIGHATCNAHRVDYEHISYSEPSALTLFRSIFVGMLRQTWEKYDYMQSHNFISPQAVELTLSRALFMVDEQYTLNEIKRQRNRLIKAFHPDSNKDIDATKYTEKINNAYKILKDNLR